MANTETTNDLTRGFEMTDPQGVCRVCGAASSEFDVCVVADDRDEWICGGCSDWASDITAFIETGCFYPELQQMMIGG
jgi:hypothetical protein